MPQWDIEFDRYVRGSGIGSVSCAAEEAGDTGDGVVLIDGDGLVE